MARTIASVVLLAGLTASSIITGSAKALAQPEPAEGAITFLPGVAGDYFPLESTHVGRRFHIFVKLPESYAMEPERRYPVSYLLDGDSLYPMLAPQHLFLTYDEAVPEAIVVGIAYGGFDPSVNMRHIDFRATLEDGTTGGAPNFLRMISEELLPRIDAAYRTDPSRRTLFGQSRGGAFVLYAANEQPSLFQAFIASNPGREPDQRLYGVTSPRPNVRTTGVVVVTSGSRDRDYLRAGAEEWGRLVAARDDLPWRAELVEIPGGTHAASVTQAYRAGMLRAFGIPDQQSAATAGARK
jgi:predicted alpha/beta superfamily hydrolase